MIKIKEQITHRESRTLFLGILLFSMEFYRNPIVVPGILYTFQTSDFPLGQMCTRISFGSHFSQTRNQGHQKVKKLKGYLLKLLKLQPFEWLNRQEVNGF